MGLGFRAYWDLAKILISKSEEETKTVVLGICGLDSSLLTSLAPLRAEACSPATCPIGLSGISSSSDAAGVLLHGLLSNTKIKELHEDVWQSAALASTAPTPKAPATGRRLVHFCA